MRLFYPIRYTISGRKQLTNRYRYGLNVLYVVSWQANKDWTEATFYMDGIDYAVHPDDLASFKKMVNKHAG